CLTRLARLAPFRRAHTGRGLAPRGPSTTTPSPDPLPTLISCTGSARRVPPSTALCCATRDPTRHAHRRAHLPGRGRRALWVSFRNAHPHRPHRGRVDSHQHAHAEEPRAAHGADRSGEGGDPSPAGDEPHHRALR